MKEMLKYNFFHITLRHYSKFCNCAYSVVLKIVTFNTEGSTGKRFCPGVKFKKRQL